MLPQHGGQRRIIWSLKNGCGTVDGTVDFDTRDPGSNPVIELLVEKTKRSKVCPIFNFSSKKFWKNIFILFQTIHIDCYSLENEKWNTMSNLATNRCAAATAFAPGNNALTFHFKKWTILGLFFLYFRLFNTAESKQMLNKFCR